MIRVLVAGVLAVGILASSGSAWAGGVPLGAGQDPSPGGRPAMTPIQWDRDDHHHRREPVVIGCVHTRDECHHAAEHAGYDRHRVVHDSRMCRHEPHLVCIARE